MTGRWPRDSPDDTNSECGPFEWMKALHFLPGGVRAPVWSAVEKN
jgi:hypothetical protein